MKTELIRNSKAVIAVLPTVTPLSAGVENGLVIDRLAFRTGIALLAVGSASGTPTSFSVDMKIQHGDESNGSDMADYEDVDGNVYEATQLIADDTQTYLNIFLDGAKRYVRVVITVAFVDGTTPAIPVNASLTLGDVEDTNYVS